MDICFITDSNYLLATMTAIKSVILSNKKEKISIYVLFNKLSEAEINQISKLKTKNAEVCTVDASDKLIDIGKEHLYVSKSALLKFYLPNIFPDKDKILYLDGDVLIKRNLKSLYKADFGDNYAVVVKDMLAQKKGYGESSGNSGYFNSGVMLLNLKKMRDDDISLKLIEHKKKQDKGLFMDQDTLNVIFGDRVKHISPIYNFMLYNLQEFKDEEIMDFYNITSVELQDVKNHYVILHMTNVYKPWEYVKSPCFKEFSNYLLRLPDCDAKSQAMKKLFNNNRGMIIKYYLRQNVLISKLVDFYEHIKYKK